MGCSTAADNSEWITDCDGGEQGSALSSFLRSRGFNYTFQEIFPLNSSLRDSFRFLAVSSNV